MPHFHVLGRDHVGQPQRRQEARTEHLALAEKLKGEGKLIHAGALLDAEGNMAGSVLLYHVESREALDQLLETEPYILRQVFETVEVTEYKPA
ncbi:MAG: hypothetical protein HRU11_05520, partial [Parvularculaceae bacterium]|nr:hypothetical protein [Parvularculaceae bacterium]